MKQDTDLTVAKEREKEKRHYEFTINGLMRSALEVSGIVDQVPDEHNMISVKLDWASDLIIGVQQYALSAVEDISALMEEVEELRGEIEELEAMQEATRNAGAK